MKYMKVIITLSVWHLIPFWFGKKWYQESLISEYGWLCFRLVITWKGGNNETI